MFDSEKIDAWLRQGMQEGQEQASAKINEARAKLSARGEEVHERAESMLKPIILEIGRLLGNLQAIKTAAKEDLKPEQTECTNESTGCGCDAQGENACEAKDSDSY